jgi:hypothetical protein
VEGKKYQVEQADKEADRCRRHARNSRGNALAIALTDHENGSDHRPHAAKEVAIFRDRIYAGEHVSREPIGDKAGDGKNDGVKESALPSSWIGKASASFPHP